MGETRKKLSDILHNSERDSLSKNWESTKAAEDVSPLPPGEYLCRILTGELFTSNTRHTPGYKLTLQVTQGEHEGRRLWHDIWLTAAALPMAKRDLAKIGVTQLDQLDRPLPQGILLKAKVVLRKEDDGTERNRVIRFEAAGIEPGDAFAPGPEEDGGGPDTSFNVPESEPSPPPPTKKTRKRRGKK